MSVRSMQETLIALGYSVGSSGADGKWGKNTEAAINAALKDLEMWKPGAKYVPPTVVAGLKAEAFGLPLFMDNVPAVMMKRIHIHWTAGAYVASELDKEHYHYLVEEDCDIVRGDFTIQANVPPLIEGHYAAHTLGANSYAIGVSMCCMAGAVEGKTNGKFPMTRQQFDKMIQLVAFLSLKYGISVTDRTVLTHAEVQANLGIKQRGKWDITVLPFNPDYLGARSVGDYIRRRVVEARNGNA